ncbi:MAG: hypothetical protein ACRCUY_08225 [Thermoguttaceae bacterium]
MSSQIRLVFVFAITASLLIGVAGSVVFGQRDLVSNNPAEVSKPVISRQMAKEPEKKRIREGTPFRDKKVFFRPLGNRTALFSVEDNEQYVCLENLILERILKEIELNPARSVWKVDGVFTEFQKSNLILLQYAVVVPGE